MFSPCGNHLRVCLLPGERLGGAALKKSVFPCLEGNLENWEAGEAAFVFFKTAPYIYIKRQCSLQHQACPIFRVCPRGCSAGQMLLGAGSARTHLGAMWSWGPSSSCSDELMPRGWTDTWGWDPQTSSIRHGAALGGRDSFPFAFSSTFYQQLPMQ